MTINLKEIILIALFVLFLLVTMSFESIQFFEQIKERIKTGIQKKNFNLEKIIKFISSQKKEDLLDKLQNISYDFQFFDEVQKFHLYGNIFTIIKNNLKRFKKLNNLPLILITNPFIEQFFDDIIRLLVLERFCSECNSTNIKSTYPISEEHLIFICDDCQKRVRVFHKAQHLPVFLMYITEWILHINRKKVEITANKLDNPYREFLNFLFINCFDHFSEQGNLNAIILFYEVLKKNKIYLDVLSDKEYFKQILIESIKKSLLKNNLYDFEEGYTFYQQNNFGDIKEDLTDFKKLIITMIIDSLSSGNYTTLINSINFFTNHYLIDIQEWLSIPDYTIQIEQAFYEGLSNCLGRESFDDFENIIDLSIRFDIFFDVKKIPNRFELLTNLLLECLRNLMSGAISDMGRIISIIRFFNNYNILEREFTNKERDFLGALNIDKKIISNLNDLFGKVSTSLIYFTSIDLPRINYKFFRETSFPYLAAEMDIDPFDINQIVNMLMGYLNQYPVYGLSIQNIGKVNHFVRKVETAMKKREKDDLLVEFRYKGRNHLVSPDNILKSVEKILDKEHYNFYSLSMVLLGGLGPQGHGFTYSTPRGEVVEICSDQRESEAIIVKYKQFLKKQFLKRLEKEMSNMRIDVQTIKKTIDYLSDILVNRELINYYKKNPILKKLNSFFTESERKQEDFTETFKNLINKISNAMDIILRPIDMIDQFKCRMDLVAEEKIKSEDIAKLTSLKDKSHYDVLRERFFFQHVIEAFTKISDEEKSKLENKRYSS
jgi:hypothetical protein